MRTIARDSHKIMARNAHAHVPDDLCDPCAVINDFMAVAGFDFEWLGDADEDAMTYLSYHVIQKLLPGGSSHNHFLYKLDAIADWAKKRVDKNGHLIPIVFRPWHELNGGWFWWGPGNDAHNTADDVKNLYRETVKYLRDHKGVHNFLYAWSPDCTGSDTDVYPGNSYVDVIGMDCYLSDHTTPQVMVQKLDKYIQQAEAADKIPALTEIGIRGAKLREHPHWYTQEVLHTLTSSSRGMRIAYMLTWANLCHGSVCDEYDPWPGHPTADDYLKFYHDSHTIFLSDLKAHYSLLYQ
nr:hypothetical protein BaRGS_017819 [Batillaria attramentaria]